MNETDVLELRAIIEKRQVYLRGVIGDNQATTDSTQRGCGTVAQSTVPVDVHILKQANLELAQLARSLARLNTDDADSCESCGCEIPLERLKTIPTTVFCVTCVEKRL